MMISLLEIPKRSPICCQGKEVLCPGTDYYSVLLEDTTGQVFVRQDFCAACWEGKAQEGLNPSIRSHWKGKVPLHAQPQVFDSQSQDQQIFTMLHEALAREGVEAARQALVLALYLARKKKLILRQEIRKEEKPFLLYEVSATEEMIAIPKEKLSPSDMQKIQSDLTQQLKK